MDGARARGQTVKAPSRAPVHVNRPFGGHGRGAVSASIAVHLDEHCHLVWHAFAGCERITSIEPRSARIELDVDLSITAPVSAAVGFGQGECISRLATHCIFGGSVFAFLGFLPALDDSLLRKTVGMSWLSPLL